MSTPSTDKRQRPEYDGEVWPSSGVLRSCGRTGRYRIASISSLDGQVTAAPSTGSYHVDHGYWRVAYTEGNTERTILCTFDQATVLVDRIAGVLAKMRSLRGEADKLAWELVRHGRMVNPATDVRGVAPEAETGDEPVAPTPG